MTRKQKSTFTEDDSALLAELGVEKKEATSKEFSATEERVIAGFEEIKRFVAEHGRRPLHGENRDIFERLYAVRLDQIRKSDEFVTLLSDMDPDGLLSGESTVREEEPEYNVDSDEELLAALGASPSSGNDLTRLKHVRSKAEIRAAEEIARRQPCDDFDRYRPVFDAVQSELDTGLRITQRYQTEDRIELGDQFIVEGNKVLVATLGEEFIDANNRIDRRLQLIYDNGTESNLLLRSLQKALWRDPAGRRIMEVGHDPYPLFTEAQSTSKTMFVGERDEDDETTGFLYILRSQSTHPFVVKNQDLLHKIGFTRGIVEERIVGATSEPAFLMAGVDVVASYRIANASAAKLENVMHRFFASARIDVKLREEVGGFVEPREWFLVPLAVINEAINLVKSGDIGIAKYDVDSAQILRL